MLGGPLRLGPEDSRRGKNLRARALEADPSRRDASQHLAKAQLSLQDWDAAIATAKTVLDSEPENYGFRAIAGRASHGKGDYAAALDHFRKVLAVQPDDPQILKLAGDSALQSGDSSFAVQTFSQLAANDANAAMSAVQTLRENRLTEAAASVLETVIQRHPGDEKVRSRAHALVRELVLRANMALQANNELEAAKFHAVALRLEPDSRPSQRIVQKFVRDTRRGAREAQKEGDIKRALSALEDLRSLTPDDPQLLFDIAQIKHKSSDPGSPEAWLATAQTGPHEDGRLLTIAERLYGYGHVAESAVVFRGLTAAAAQQENGLRIRNKLIVGLQHALTKARAPPARKTWRSCLRHLQASIPKIRRLRDSNPKPSH
ncbi:MAG: tetratricopeptide repeat protein [Rhodomicrobium sp.]|nr:tetratricopeptide repeat protein [Rhodomicrobium sp.]